ncbi:hypothetical protein BH20ACT22_BH20ACT22_21830 [soil metagenome]|jgi:hypothetical protein|nr:hypothetical protein [Actinomycetota bacterium]MDQ3533925.1 hypothetical protein [Actinomycetota bacterium]
MIVPGGLVGGMGPVPLNHRFRVSLRTFAWHLRHLIHTQADLEQCFTIRPPQVHG